MVRGQSKRIVIEIDPELKKSLYIELAKEGRTLKDWFVEKVIQKIEDKYPQQLSLTDMLKKDEKT